MRTASDEVARGNGQLFETYVEVRWEWAILPIGVLVFSTAFFIWTGGYKHESPRTNLEGQ